MNCIFQLRALSMCVRSDLDRQVLGKGSGRAIKERNNHNDVLCKSSKKVFQN